MARLFFIPCYTLHNDLSREENIYRGFVTREIVDAALLILVDIATTGLLAILCYVNPCLIISETGVSRHILHSIFHRCRINFTDNLATFYRPKPDNRNR